MGNGNAKYENITEMKNATFDEVTCLSLKRYAAYGTNVGEALNNLKNVCQEKGIPQPTKTSSGYVCGTLDIPYLFKYKKRYNPVWHSQRNGRHVAFVYYYKL